jgi:hypothetical protein
MSLVRDHRDRTLALIGLTLLCSYWGPRASAEDKAGRENPVELTKEDLFSLQDWQQRPVAVDGFTLGMTRKQAVAMAEAKNLSIKSNMAPATVGELNAPCLQGSCSVYKVRGNYIGIDLFLETGRVTKVSVAVSEDMDLEVRKVNIAREFKGLTFRFFNDYSDNLRKQILGSAEGKEKPALPGAATTYVEYDYPRQGLVLHTTIDKRDHPPKPFDLQVDFVSRPSVR